MIISFSASDFHQLYKPSYCELRYWLLKAEQYKKHEVSAFDELIMKLGLRHEKAQLDLLVGYIDLSQGTQIERGKLTVDNLKQKNIILYQPVLMADLEIAGEYCSLIGIPDFILIEEGKLIIRDVKLAKRITEKDHPEILLQLQFYGFLAELITGSPPYELQVLSGDGRIVKITQDHLIKKTLFSLHSIQRLSTAPYSPVGVSKCNGCLYTEDCWKDAINKKDTAVVPGVDQNLTLSLREIGINDYDGLLKYFDAESFAEFKRPWGTKLQKVGKRSTEILRNANALLHNTELFIKPISMPKHDNFVMFDLEGLPPYIDEIEKIYLWGMQVYGKNPTKFIPALAGFGDDGDREGWIDFLKKATEIFNEYGDIPWVHWANYEKTKINLYIDRFGDPDGIGARVLNNLLDLLPITQNSIALPIYSYSLKVIEKYLGFTRSQDEYGGAWSIAKYIEAIETSDLDLKNKFIADVMQYNEEDLNATWVVTEWLLKKQIMNGK